jgi:large subunit ribosomal protein L4
MQLPIRNFDNAEVGSLDVADTVFGTDVRKDILARVVTWQLAKRRAGTHKVKERGEVKATAKKMYKQKGTGRARHGNEAAVQFRGGGVVHGPRVRDHGYDLQKKVRALGLRCALSAKAGDGKLIVVETLDAGLSKTKELVAKLDGMGIRSALVLGGAELNEGFARAASNIVGVDVLPQQGANVYDILRRDTLIMTRDAVEHLEARLK